MSEPDTRPAFPKRFYETVAVEADGEGFAVRLDGRAVRTPARAPLAVPARAVAEAIAQEWRAQRDVVDPATMPVTRLANTVIDGVAQNAGVTIDDLSRYAETDLLAYRADHPPRLVERQAAAWDPIVEWARTRYGVSLRTASGVMFLAQPPETVSALRAAVAERGAAPFRLAALHQITTLTGSLLLALAVAEGVLDVQAAWAAAHVDEDWNIELWGEDAEASARRAGRHADMRAAELLLRAD